MSAVESSGAERALGALLQANGGRVRLRTPMPASTGDSGEELGLATPAFQDVELGRGVLRNASTLLLGAAAMRDACGSQESAAALSLLTGAAGVSVDEEFCRIESVQALYAHGDVYGYALTLVAPGRTAGSLGA